MKGLLETVRKKNTGEQDVRRVIEDTRMWSGLGLRGKLNQLLVFARL